jgi:hypothetical protein
VVAGNDQDLPGREQVRDVEEARVFKLPVVTNLPVEGL